jgi:hypothetical protein
MVLRVLAMLAIAMLWVVVMVCDRGDGMNSRHTHGLTMWYP